MKKDNILSINLPDEDNNQADEDSIKSHEIFKKISEDFISLTPYGLEKPVLIRKDSNDLYVYQDIFTDKCYAFKKNREVNIVVDVGAFIGLSSVFFASLYPNANIIALEPAKSERNLCVLNSKLYSNITVLPAALWTHKEDLFLFKANEAKPFKYVGPQEEITEETLYPVIGIPLETLLVEAKIEKIDILKLSIDGLEETILKNASEWIKKIDSLIIKTQSTTALMTNPVLKSLKEHFETSWQQDTICFFSKGAIEAASKESSN
tara:strand:- start:223 stop:1014 length:792 start_codon:yes stop_codon:yes gene_type:complete